MTTGAEDPLTVEEKEKSSEEERRDYVIDLFSSSLVHPGKVSWYTLTPGSSPVQPQVMK